MTWIDLPAVEGLDWARPEFVSQFIHAANERRPAGRAPGDPSNPFHHNFLERDPDRIARPLPTSGVLKSEFGPMPDPSEPIIEVGDYVARTSLWSALQAEAESGFGLGPLSSTWLDPEVPIDLSHNPHALGNGNPGAQLALNLLTLAQAREKAGVHPDGFERRFPTPGRPKHSNDVSVAYGRIQEGDYIGSWIFNELQALFNVKVVAAVIGFPLSLEGTDRSGLGTHTDEVDGPDWGTAKADAEANWGAGNPAELGGTNIQGLAAGFTYGRDTGLTEPGSSFQAHTFSRRWRQRIDLVNHVGRQVIGHANPTRNLSGTPTEFHSHLYEPWVTGWGQGQWVNHYDSGATSEMGLLTDWIGDDSLFPWVDEPPQPSGGKYLIKSLFVGEVFYARYDVVGGFQFV